MAQPLSLISAQVQFMDDRLALVHIPLDLYPFFLQPILQLVFNEVPAIQDPNVDETDEEPPEATNTAQLAFLNLSITPVECSVVCSRQLAEEHFAPLADKFNQIAGATGSRVSISKEDFIVMQVDGQGLDAGERVLELTSPLAMAGISIFFISTYFSDYILVPLRSKGQVIRALEKRGFTFEVTADAFVNSSNPQYNGTFSIPTSPQALSAQHSPPATPPPPTLSELQTRTFASLRRHNIVPRVDKTLRLVQCAAHHRFSETSSASILRPALTTALIVDKPRFLSLTLTATDPAASILLEKRLLPRFSQDPTSGLSPDEDSSLLLGSKEDILIPIMLDLRELPLEATGIVCGVASRLAEATHSRNDAARLTTSASVTSLSSLNSHPFFLAGSPPLFALSPSDSLSLSNINTAPPSPPNTDSHHHNRHHQNHHHDKKKDNNHNRNHPTLTPPTHHLEPDPESYPDAVEISFLSTARAGTVIVGERELSRAVDALDAESRELESEDDEKEAGDGTDEYP